MSNTELNTTPSGTPQPKRRGRPHKGHEGAGTVLITGGLGQLGEALLSVSVGKKYDYVAVGSSSLNICDEDLVEEWVWGLRAKAVINCAAYTNVEAAEEEPERANMVNGKGVDTLAKVCQRYGIPVIHISTDYVFGGDRERNTPYDEEETPAPINAYGQSKLLGEQALSSYSLAVVIRTSWLYSPWGKNFYRTIDSLSRTQHEISVVEDQRGTPTSALSLARFIINIIESHQLKKMSGIYHFSDSGEATWYDFARAIVELNGTGCCVKPTTSTQRPTRAQRPHYSVLGKRRITELGVTPPPWQEALAEVYNYFRQ